MHTGYAFLAALAVMAMSLIGVVFTSQSIGAWMRKYLTYLATFSAGVFLLIAYHLSREAVEDGGWLVGLAAVALGAALMEGIHYLLPNKHHHHGHLHDHAHSPIDGRRVLVSDALHNVGDGIMLVGAFAAGTPIGIAATVGVLLHEAVQEISEYFVLREAAYSHWSALSRNCAVSATILIGVAAATLLSTSEIILALLSGIAAGGFFSVVLHDLIPHAIHSVRTHGGAYRHLVAGIFGAIVMFGMQSAVTEAPSEYMLKIAPEDKDDATVGTLPYENFERDTTIPAPTSTTTSEDMNPIQNSGVR